MGYLEYLPINKSRLRSLRVGAALGRRDGLECFILSMLSPNGSQHGLLMSPQKRDGTGDKETPQLSSLCVSQPDDENLAKVSERFQTSAS